MSWLEDEVLLILEKAPYLEDEGRQIGRDAYVIAARVPGRPTSVEEVQEALAQLVSSGHVVESGGTYALRDAEVEPLVEEANLAATELKREARK